MRTVIVRILYITREIIDILKESQTFLFFFKGKIFHTRVKKTLPLDLFAVLCLRFNSIDYTFHFPKCHLPEGAGGVCCFHLTDILAMWCTASVGSINQFTAR